MRQFILILTASLLGSAAASAATLAFVPPNDTTGMVYTTNSNDGWSNGRGIVFQLTSNRTISSVGLLEDLTNVDLNYAIYQTTGPNGNVRTGQTLLQSGDAMTTTSGLEWVDFSFTPLLLTSGNSYHIEFSFSGSGNQNFFYNNQNVPWDQANYTQLDGTQNGNTSNFVVAAFRVGGEIPNTPDAPEPASVAMILGGLFLVAVHRRRGIPQE